jgi:hypothetical protein
VTDEITAHPTPVFADQVAPGMLIEHPGPLGILDDRWVGRAFVTQVRATAGHSIFGDNAQTITILGAFEDGRPFSYCCGAHMVWHVHETAQLAAGERP